MFEICIPGLKLFDNFRDCVEDIPRGLISGYSDCVLKTSDDSFTAAKERDPSLFGRDFLPLEGKDKTLRTKSRKQLANAFIKQWRNKCSWRGKNLCPAEILEKQVGSLAKAFLNGSLYKPYRMKW